MFTYRYSDCTFGEEALQACNRHQWVLVCSLDGVDDLGRIGWVLSYLGLDWEGEGPPIFPTSMAAQLHLDDEAWFPNMSAIALFDKKPERITPIAAAYMAFPAYASPLAGHEPIITRYEAERWMSEMGVQELIAWSEQLVIVTPADN